MSKKMTSRVVSELPSFREVIINAGLISSTQAVDVERLCFETGVNFATGLMFKGYCSVERMARLLEEKVSIKSFPLKSIPGLGKVKNLIAEEKAKELQVFPLTLIEESGQRVLLLGMTDPLDISAIRKIEFLTHLKVQPAFLALDEMQSLYLKYFRRGLEIFPVEVTFYGEQAASSRANAVEGSIDSKVSGNREKKLIQALSHLLIKKGIISQEELDTEIKKLSS